jgi:thioredoxin 1
MVRPLFGLFLGPPQRNLFPAAFILYDKREAQMKLLKDIGTVLAIVVAIIGLKYLIDRPDGPPGGKVGVLGDEAFAAEVLKAEAPVAVEFRSRYCSACKMFRGKFEDASVKFDGKMRFFELDINDSPRSAEKYRIESLPTTHIFVGGHIFATLRGNVSAKDLEAKSAAAIAKAQSLRDASARRD